MNPALKGLLKGLPRGWAAEAEICVTFGPSRSYQASGLRDLVAKTLRRLADRLDARESIILSVTGDASSEAVQEAWRHCRKAFFKALEANARVEMLDRLIKEDDHVQH